MPESDPGQRSCRSGETDRVMLGKLETHIGGPFNRHLAFTFSSQTFVLMTLINSADDNDLFLVFAKLDYTSNYVSMISLSQAL